MKTKISKLLAVILSVIFVVSAIPAGTVMASGRTLTTKINGTTRTFTEGANIGDHYSAGCVVEAGETTWTSTNNDSGHYCCYSNATAIYQSWWGSTPDHHYDNFLWDVAETPNTAENMKKWLSVSEAGSRVTIGNTYGNYNGHTVIYLGVDPLDSNYMWIINTNGHGYGLNPVERVAWSYLPTYLSSSYSKIISIQWPGAASEYTKRMTTHTHSYGEWQTITPATCTTAGSQKRVCSCGDTQTQAIPAKGHTPVTDSAVAATCTATGLTEGTYCSDCKAIITVQQVIPALGHDNQLESIDRGCESVSAVYSCKRCGQITNLENQDYIFSDWLPIKPSDLPEELIEEKTQTRYRDKVTTYNDGGSTLDGWIYSDQSEIVYGSWSANKTASSKPTESDMLRITSTTKHYNYYHYCCNYYDGTYNVDSISYGSGSHFYHTYKTTTPLSASSVGDMGGKTLYGNHTCEKGFNVWAKADPFETYTYTYQTRTKTTRYYFYKWTDWADWADEQVEFDEMREVETRTVYRYKIVPAGHTSSDWITDTPAQPGVAGSKHKECTECHTVLQTEIIPPLEVIDENAPQVVVENKRVTAGGTVNIKIALKNNPGIASMKLQLTFGSDLTLTNVAFNNEIGGNFQQPQTFASPVLLNWYNGVENANGDFVFATLTFKVAENAAPGEKYITTTYDPEDVYNIAEQDIDFAVVGGRIDVLEYIPGDINGDGSVNNKDLTRLFQYLSGWDVAVNSAALDVNGDGNSNNKDLTRLFQYLSGWDVSIF